MPPKKRPGMTGFYVELPDELLAEFERFVESFPLGSKAQHVRLALRRHMDNPPKAVITPHGETPMEGPAKPKKGKR